MGYVVSSVPSGRVNDVRILADSKTFGTSGNQYAILAFYIEYGLGTVEGLAFHPQQQSKSNVGDNGYYAPYQFYGNMFVYGPSTTSTPTVVSLQTGGALSVQINIANDPAILGSIQTITLTVLDSKGQPVPDATVHVEITCPYTSPSGNPSIWEGLADRNGKYALTWQIAAEPDNIGTFQVKASATKAGYETGQADATFQVTSTFTATTTCSLSIDLASRSHPTS
jgi:hypothetical protein